MRNPTALAAAALAIVACQPGAPRSGTLSAAPATQGGQLLATFSGEVDLAAGTLTVRAAAAPGAGMLVTLPEGGGPDTVAVTTVGLPGTVADGCGAGQPAFTGDVEVRSFFATAALREVYAQVDTLSASNHEACNSAPAVPGTSSALGLFSYGDLGVAGSAGDRATTTWSFHAPDQTFFTFTGRILGTPVQPVLEHHADPRRDGVYVDASLTRASAGTFHVDPGFSAAVSGEVHAQPLVVANGPGGKPAVIVATEQNEVYALDAATGAALWTRQLGAPVPLADLPCGNIDPLGVTGTPYADPGTRTLYVDAMTTPDGGTTRQHLVFALSLDDGSTRAGWPVDVAATASFGGVAFDATVQNQRGALALVGGTLYVPYGGHFGDCGEYRGWLVGIPTASPSAVQAWSTGGPGGGMWGPSGVASDGTSLYVATGNTFGAASWVGGEALLRFAAGPVFSGAPADYFAPSNWQALDLADVDIGGSGALLVDVAGATPSQLVVALGKDGKIYLADRANLGGIGGTTGIPVSSGEIIGAAAAYTTALGTYVVFGAPGASCPSGQSGDLTAVRILPGSPPTVTTAWCAQQNGPGSPMVTTTDGHAEAIVWGLGAGVNGDHRLHGFDGDTGAVVYGGGGAGDLLGTVSAYQTPILSGGRIFVAANGAVHALVR